MSLWQKPDADRSARKAAPAPSSAPASSKPKVATPTPSWESRAEEKRGGLGQSITLRGELSGAEDLVINGRVEGKICLTDHDLTIGKTAQIKADVQAKCVVVLGSVVGNVTAGDKVEIASSGSVEGDLTAPRVALADGSSFKGSIDTGNDSGQSSAVTYEGASSGVPLAAQSTED